MLITEEMHRQISKQLKLIEIIMRRKKIILSFTKTTNVPVYWSKREERLGKLAKSATRVKLMLRDRFNEKGEYQIVASEHKELIDILDAGFKHSNALISDLRASRKLINNVLEVIHYEINSHLLQDVFDIKVDDIDKVILEIANIYDNHEKVMKLLEWK